MGVYQCASFECYCGMGDLSVSVLSVCVRVYVYVCVCMSVFMCVSVYVWVCISVHHLSATAAWGDIGHTSHPVRPTFMRCKQQFVHFDVISCFKWVQMCFFTSYYG